MQKFSLILSLLFSFNASAQLIIPADSSICGPYPYKTKLGEIKYLPVLKTNSISQGFFIANEMPKLKSFLDSWFSFFANNGDQKAKFKMLCYGFYDDAASTGANALAYGDQAILIGTKMKWDIQHSLDAFVSNQLQFYHPGTQATFLNLNKTAAESFLIFHELSHTFQNMHGLTFSGPTAKQKELHADCSGAMMFTISRILNKTWKSEDMMAAMMYAYALGDNNVTDSDHHGYPDHRQNAFSEGMRSAINLKSAGYDLSKVTSKDIMDVCSKIYQ
jgi:hypothetical protein